MNKVNVGLVRLLQFVVFAFFTFMVLTYFGALILLPLDAVVLLVKLMSALGLDGFIGAFIAVPIVGYLALSVYKMPGLASMLIEIGMDIVANGKARIEAFNELAEQAKA